ncbi:MAG TPA: YihY/virulence factor BrkB family protein [Chloroflexota bacterium]
MRTFITKVRKDNIGALAAIVSWNALTSVIPIMVSLLAISGFLLRGNPSAQHTVVTHLSQALKGVVTPADLNSFVDITVRHAGLLGLIGLLGALWGGSNVGGAISTAFQPVFEVKGRMFVLEKLIDIVMIVVIAVMMIVIVVGTTAGTVVDRLIAGFPFSGLATTVVGTLISVLAAFLLFGAIYVVFPNIEHRFRFKNVQWGALAAAILFVALTYIWPLYAHFAHFGRYGAVLFPILLLTAWIYLFSVILLVGAEVVAIGALQSARQEKQAIGPAPDGTVPQHVVLRNLHEEGELEIERRPVASSDQSVDSSAPEPASSSRHKPM